MKRLQVYILVFILFGLACSTSAQQLTVTLEIEEEFGMETYQSPDFETGLFPGETVNIPFGSSDMAVLKLNVPSGVRLLSKVRIRAKSGEEMENQHMNIAWGTRHTNRKENLYQTGEAENELIIPEQIESTSLYLYIYGSFKIPDEFSDNPVIYDLSIDYY